MINQTNIHWVLFWFLYSTNLMKTSTSPLYRITKKVSFFQHLLLIYDTNRDNDTHCTLYFHLLTLKWFHASCYVPYWSQNLFIFSIYRVRVSCDYIFNINLWNCLIPNCKFYVYYCFMIYKFGENPVWNTLSYFIELLISCMIPL